MSDVIFVIDFVKKKTTKENTLQKNVCHQEKMKSIYKQEFQERHEKRLMIYTVTWMLHVKFQSF